MSSDMDKETLKTHGSEVVVVLSEFFRRERGAHTHAQHWRCWSDWAIGEAALAADLIRQASLLIHWGGCTSSSFSRLGKSAAGAVPLEGFPLEVP